MRPKERYKFMARLPSNSDDRQIGENYIPDYNTIVAKNMKPKNIKTTNQGRRSLSALKNKVRTPLP